LTGLLIGLACGAGELYLLTRLTLAVQNGKPYRILGIVFLKLVLFACALVPVILFARSDILWCGVGISSLLVLGAIFINLRNQKKGKGDQ